MVKEEHIDVAGQPVAFVSTAGSGRPVVLVHGNSSSSRVWRQVLDHEVGQRYRCLALDLPGHGRSGHARSVEDYSLPGYSALLAGFLEQAGAQDAVVIGWSLGGHVAFEAMPHLTGAAGFVVFGTPPIGTGADFGKAFLPNPALDIGFTPDVTADAGLTYSRSFLAPGSFIPDDRFVADILATDPAARTGLGASIQAGRFADEVETVGRMKRPLAVLHGEHDQLVDLRYVQSVAMPTLWRDEVQVVRGAGHAVMVEAPEEFSRLVCEFVDGLE